MRIAECPIAVIRDMEGCQTGTIHRVEEPELNFPLWSQRDPRWGGDRLGTSSWTVGQKGCLVDALAMGITKALGQEVTPGELNAKLTANASYVGGCNLVFNRVEKACPGVRLLELNRCRNTPAPSADIARWVEGGDIVVVLVDYDVSDPDVDQHWVLIVGGDKGVLKIHDPWPMPVNQQQLLLPPAYCKKDWDPARAIFAYAWYGALKSVPH